MIVASLPKSDRLRAAFDAAALEREDRVVEKLLAATSLDAAARRRISDNAARLVERVRDPAGKSGIDVFMQEYDLSTQEGVALMCLAEALLRVPDAETADRLIAEKIGAADWQGHLGHSESLFVNASTWALMLTGRVMRLDDALVRDGWDFLRRLTARSGEPIIRKAVVQAMLIMGRQFVLGRTIDEALSLSREMEKRGYRHSFDMLGESACTAADADRHFQAYRDEIAKVGKASGGRGAIEGPGVSIKLSALHPRLAFSQRERMIAELIPRVRELVRQAAALNIGLCIDTEEANRLALKLDVMEAVLPDPALRGWDGFGIAVQAYQKRALPLIDWLADLARRHHRRLSVRLVKGAYWDAEIKMAQELGLDDYPVFTRKANTDLSYLVCAERLLKARDAFYPQFATHNAHTVAAVVELAGDRRDLEFQRLHGMGEELYDPAERDVGRGIPCRIYAPVGSHEELLSYLVRRLLENGSNTSFVNRVGDADAPVADIVADPIAKAKAFRSKRHAGIPLPRHLFGAERRNSRGIALWNSEALRVLGRDMAAAPATWTAEPVIDGGKARLANEPRPVRNPADHQHVVGTVAEATDPAIDAALNVACAAAPGWAATDAAARAACLDRAADLFEANMAELMALAVREAGKRVDDAAAEVREAVDFCRYYAARARDDFAAPTLLPGPTGESNRIRLAGRGVFVCISPWNFPLAIFTGQVTAALVAGNAVIAKPAEQTPLIAAKAVALLREAGLPEGVLCLLPGDGRIGAALVGDPRIGGVCFTGSVETARRINQALAERDGPIVPLIAETGGQNAMMVDSTALPEQVVHDVVTSAFRSAGQRCSALRVLFLQRDIASRVLDMLAGATAELRVGDPADLATDVGPVIDAEAQRMLESHAERMAAEATSVYRLPLPVDCARGTFVAPQIFEIDRLDRLEREVFGPILHVVRYAGDRLDAVIDAINASRYGLTLGIHSRVDGFARYIHERVRVGNTYVNRNMIGAVVGVQPFGGEGLSGTGPKVGGPRYLHRFATERTLTVNTAAAGGNAQLLSLKEDADL